MDRQEQLFCSLRRFNSYVQTLVTFISEDAQEIYYNNTRREVGKDYNCFPGASEWEQKEIRTFYFGSKVYSTAHPKKIKPKHPQIPTPSSPYATCLCTL